MYDRMAFMDGFLKVCRSEKVLSTPKTEGLRTAQQKAPQAKRPPVPLPQDEPPQPERRIDGAS